MKIILIYDIASSNTNLTRIRKLCTKYLLHTQYSVFEGELEKHEVLNLERKVLKIIDKKKDSVILYKFFNFDKHVLGLNKNEFDGFNI